MNELKLASISDIDEIMTIISDAKAYLKKQGLKQWNLPDGYPNKSDLINDINQNECYIYLIDNTIVGVMVIMENPDENYDEIDGKCISFVKNLNELHIVEHFNNNTMNGMVYKAIKKDKNAVETSLALTNGSLPFRVAFRIGNVPLL